MNAEANRMNAENQALQLQLLMLLSYLLLVTVEVQYCLSTTSMPLLPPLASWLCYEACPPKSPIPLPVTFHVQNQVHLYV